MNDWQERIKRLFKQLGKEYLTASEMRGHFELDRRDRQDFKHLLRKLADDGFLRFDERKRIYLADSASPKKDSKPGVKIDQGEKFKLKTGSLFLKQNRWWVLEKGGSEARYPLTGIRPGLKEGQEVKFKLQKAEGRFSQLAKISSGQNFEHFRELADAFIRKQHLPASYPDSAIADLQGRKSPAEEGYAGRKDLRHLPVLCIDPLGARDHDDAISFSKRADGGWDLGVHIADVAHYVLPNTTLDAEALRRSYTQYLPWEALTMLPEQLSSGWCSLVEGEDRFALSCLIHLGPKGTVKSFEFAKTVIKVTRSITYEEAQSFKDNGDPELVAYAEMCEALRSQRLKTGILLLDMPEARVKFDDAGDPIKIEPKVAIPSMNWIEECMLIANQCCAKFCIKNKLNGVFRTHEPPQKMDIQELAFNEPDLFKAQPNVRQLLESPEAEGHGRNVDPVRFKLYTTLVESARGDSLQMRKILRSMSKARYMGTPDGHFALNWADYSHFTSPIRRYADLWVHREITAFLAGQKPKLRPEETDSMCDLISENEVTNMKNERSAVKLCATWIMKDRLGETFDGVISGIEHFGIFVEIPETGAEGLLRFQDLGDDYFQYVPERDVVVGKRSRRVFRRGDRLHVILSKVNLEDAQLDFILAQDEDDFAQPSRSELKSFARRPQDSRIRFSPRSVNELRSERSERKREFDDSGRETPARRGAFVGSSEEGRERRSGSTESARSRHPSRDEARRDSRSPKSKAGPKSGSAGSKKAAPPRGKNAQASSPRSKRK